MHYFDVYRLDLFCQNVEMPFLILPYAEKNRTTPDQQKRKKQNSNHGVLDLILNVKLQTASKKGDVDYKQVNGEDQVEENKNIGECNGNTQKADLRAAYDNGIELIQVIGQVFIPVKGCIFKFLFTAGIGTRFQGICIITCLGDELLIAVFGIGIITVQVSLSGTIPQ